VISLIKISLLFCIFDIIIYCITNYVFHATGCVFSLLYLQDLVGKPEGKRPLGRSRRRREDNIKMGFQEVGCGGVMDCIELAQVRDRWWALENAAKYFRVP
jgi:hypothetical protein